MFLLWSQIEGAFVQGLGMLTLEEVRCSQNGALWTTGPGTYKIPGFADIPVEFNVHLLRKAPNDKAIYSSKVFYAPRDSILWVLYILMNDWWWVAYWLTHKADSLTYWLTDLFTDWLSVCPPDWPSDWPCNQPADWPINERFTNWLIYIIWLFMPFAQFFYLFACLSCHWICRTDARLL